MGNRGSIPSAEEILEAMRSQAGPPLIPADTGFTALILAVCESVDPKLLQETKERVMSLGETQQQTPDFDTFFWTAFFCVLLGTEDTPAQPRYTALAAKVLPRAECIASQARSSEVREDELVEEPPPVPPGMCGTHLFTPAQAPALTLAASCAPAPPMTKVESWVDLNIDEDPLTEGEERILDLLFETLGSPKSSPRTVR